MTTKCEESVPSVRRVRDPRAWEWFARGVSTEGRLWATPASLLPAGFDTVTRIMHPAEDGSTWAQVAAESGRMAHPLMQWTHIEQRCGMPGRYGDPLGYGDRAPEEGNPPAALLEAVLEHCPAEGEVFHGVWVGYGEWADPPDDEVLAIPGRDYRIFQGPKAAHQSWPGSDRIPRGRSANLIWPADHSWVVAAEIDWMFTLVAGDTKLARALLADSRLEAYAVNATDRLSRDGDTINPKMAGAPR